ncbi:helix-turn-helix domain-containing protein [Simplicispira sp. 110]|nr:helix-turn-helix transcriptional regulator [Simplicispira sp. 110]
MSNPMHTPHYSVLRTRLVELREAKGITQAEVAAKLGKPQSYVSKYERGERRLDIIELIAVANALGVDPVQLFAELMSQKPLLDKLESVFYRGDIK